MLNCQTFRIKCLDNELKNATRIEMISYSNLPLPCPFASLLRTTKAWDRQDYLTLVIIYEPPDKLSLILGVISIYQVLVELEIELDIGQGFSKIHLQTSHVRVNIHSWIKLIKEPLKKVKSSGGKVQIACRVILRVNVCVQRDRNETAALML